MTKQDKIRALAELDGWINLELRDGVGDAFMGEKDGESNFVPFYLTSYDAIIPLIQRQNQSVKDCVDCDVGFGNRIDSTPEQLCDALLNATVKWRDE